MSWLVLRITHAISYIARHHRARSPCGEYSAAVCTSDFFHYVARRVPCATDVKNPSVPRVCVCVCQPSIDVAAYAIYNVMPRALCAPAKHTRSIDRQSEYTNSLFNIA